MTCAARGAALPSLRLRVRAPPPPAFAAATELPAAGLRCRAPGGAAGLVRLLAVGVLQRRLHARHQVGVRQRAPVQLHRPPARLDRRHRRPRRRVAQALVGDGQQPLRVAAEQRAVVARQVAGKLAGQRAGLGDGGAGHQLRPEGLVQDVVVVRELVGGVRLPAHVHVRAQARRGRQQRLRRQQCAHLRAALRHLEDAQVVVDDLHLRARARAQTPSLPGPPGAPPGPHHRLAARRPSALPAPHTAAISSSRQGAPAVHAAVPLAEPGGTPVVPP